MQTWPTAILFILVWSFYLVVIVARFGNIVCDAVVKYATIRNNGREQLLGFKTDHKVTLKLQASSQNS